jgi:hypothetical protein
MRAGGLGEPNDPCPYDCYGIEKDYPYVLDSVLGGQVCVGYAVSRKLELRMQGAVYGLERVIGHHQRSEDGGGVTVSVRPRATTLALLVCRQRGDGLLRCGAGPSLNLVRLDVDPPREITSIRPGLVLELGGCFPPRGKVFLDASLEYRWMLPAALESFELGTATHRVTMPEVHTSLGHLALSIGLGVGL